MDKLRVAVVGLGFGAEFIPIYQRYNKTECIAICRRNKVELDRIGDMFGIGKRYTDFDQMLKDPNIDAIHINSALDGHGWMAKAALQAGKHVACTVPMAMTIKECEEIVEMEKETGKVYMMMETAIYTREYLYCKKMANDGKIGRIQFLCGSHQQNLSLPGWPSYWYGLPPMHYPTHALSPLCDLAGKPLTSVRCLGSGRVRNEYVEKYNSPFAVETAQFTFADSDIVCEATRSLFDTIRQYRESFDVYGTKASFEWEQVAGENPVVYTNFEDATRVAVPDSDYMLPPEISEFALKNQIIDKNHTSFIQGDGHGGSHPHMVHEFVSAVLEGRRAYVDSKKAANWTIAGLIAHESAMKGGVVMDIPQI